MKLNPKEILKSKALFLIALAMMMRIVGLALVSKSQPNKFTVLILK